VLIRTAASHVAREPSIARASARRIDATGKWILPGSSTVPSTSSTGGLDAQQRCESSGAFTDVVGEIRRAAGICAYVCSDPSVVDRRRDVEFDLRDARVDDPLAPRLAYSGPLLATYDPPALEVGNDDPIWLMKNPEQVWAMVANLVSHKPDMIKIWFVHRAGDDLASQAALVRVAVEAAHKAGLRAAVHATTLQTAVLAVDAGADILVHSVGDRDVDDESCGRSSRARSSTCRP
jgi:hypothetical protein